MLTRKNAHSCESCCFLSCHAGVSAQQPSQCTQQHMSWQADVALLRKRKAYCLLHAAGARCALTSWCECSTLIPAGAVPMGGIDTFDVSRPKLTQRQPYRGYQSSRCGCGFHPGYFTFACNFTLTRRLRTAAHRACLGA